MTDKEITEMLKKIVSEADYYIYNSYFVYPEEPEMIEASLKRMIKIVRSFVDKEDK